MSVSAFFEHPLWSRLAAMHLHFLWQGLLIACLYWAIVKLFNVQSARLRYLLGMSGLAAMPLCTFTTFWLVEVSQSEHPPEAAMMEESGPAIPSVFAAGNDSQESTNPEDPLTLTLSPKGRGDRNVSADSLTLSPQGRGDKIEQAVALAMFQESSPTDSASSLAPVLLGGWFLGVMIFGLRLLGGVSTVVWWRWSSLPITDPKWLSILERLSGELGLARCPRLAVSLRASDAFSLGLFRPLIVLPAAWLLKLPPDTLESVLAHELAHIRRWDAWANLFQRVLEAGLFYHPAVWWLSRQMEQEREKCCDLWAVSLTGDRLQYVKTLAGVAEFQHANRLAKFNSPILATGMGGRNMVLLERVRHILGETPRTGAASRFLAGAMVLAIPAALWMGTMMLPANAADEEVPVVAQAEGEVPVVVQREGERERERGGDREARPEGERGPRGRDGERPGGPRGRDGERPGGPRGPRDGEAREGEGRPMPPRGPEGRPMPPGRGRDGERPPGFGPRGGSLRPAPQAEMMELLRELRREVEQLRQEVRQLREARGERPRPEFREPTEEEREERRRRFEESRRREGEAGRPRPEADRPRPESRRPEGDRPRPESRRPEGDRPQRPRPEGERAEQERETVRERLQEAREERDRPEREQADE